MKLEIHTIRFGNPEWLPFCARSLDDWCRRHSLPLKIWNETNIDSTYPADKFCEVDMLKEFLAGDNDVLGYVDADVWIEYDAPLPPIGEGITICPDRPCKWVRDWPDWCRENFSGTHDVDNVLQDKVYYNAGIWYIDREAAEILLSVIEEPYIEHCQEQDQWNWWLALAKDEGMEITELPRKWNCFPTEYEEAFFHHIAGTRKMEKTVTKMKLGLMPQAPEPFAIPPFQQCDRAIVIPWKRDRARWEELRYAIRSIQKNFADKECPIYILGDFDPCWRHLRVESRVKYIDTCLYHEALIKGLTLADKILWTNDDIVFLKPCDWETFDTAYYTKEQSITDGKQLVRDNNEWVAGYGRALISLAKLNPGKTLYNFSTHLPYVFEREKGLEILRLYGAYHKVPMETLYHNHWNTPAKQLGNEKTGSPGDRDALFLNFNDSSLTPELMKFIENEFPERQVWEIRS